MLPTLTIPNVAAPPQRGSEPANSPAAEGEGNDAFADALQRAQGEPKPAAASESRSKTSKSTDSHARSTRQAQAKGPAREAAQQPAGDAESADAAGCAEASESSVGATASRTPETREETTATSLAPPPAFAIDATLAPRAAIEAHRSGRPRAADSEDPDLAIDDRAPFSRANARSGGAHDLRGGPSTSGRPTPQNESATGRDTAAIAMPLHAALEHALADAASTTAANQRVPTFDRQAAESSAAPLPATLLVREMNSAAAAPGTDAKLPQITLHAAIDEPGFGAALGSQVSLWVRDGVQEARLQLHPAELGPVTVQIALDGQAAHVDFTAAVAATRDSIEQSLPALAAALRESGFTLAGGGVSSHAGQGGGDERRQRAGAGHGNRSRADDGADDGPLLSAPRRWTRSLLDVYA
jgi:flagellar hook-length control protein FliK